MTTADETRELLEVARSMLRDAILYNYPERELCADPVEVIEQITAQLMDEYCIECSEVDGIHTAQCPQVTSE
jgi:hypothetical protein